MKLKGGWKNSDMTGYHRGLIVSRRLDSGIPPSREEKMGSWHQRWSPSLLEIGLLI